MFPFASCAGLRILPGNPAANIVFVCQNLSGILKSAKFKVGHHPENFGTYGTSHQNKLLVGGMPTPLKNMSSSVGIIIPNIWKVIIHSCSKPPTRLI